jgi:chemotaxis protein methyltransferase CheR
VKDAECVQFLQAVLPRLHMRWPGFRRVRGQVCKRLQRRLRELDLASLSAYLAYLDAHEAEWRVLDGLCRVTVSRFYRDKMVFAQLAEQVMPYLLEGLRQRGATTLRIWCAGSGAGEEPYTLSLLWAQLFQARYPDIVLSIVATDANPDMLQRARRACYPYSAIKNLPPAWREAGFAQQADEYRLHSVYQAKVEFLCQDLRALAPPGRFHLILCRNLAFTYFDEPLQREILRRLHASLETGGVLVIGVHESLPAGEEGFSVWSKRLGVYRKIE